MINTFTIANKTYSIRLTDHAEKRLKQRNIDMFNCMSAILALGEERIIKYSGSNRDILISDKQNNFAIVICIEGYQIRIVTVIDHSDAFAKSGTTVINL